MTACCVADFILSTYGRKLFAVEKGVERKQQVGNARRKKAVIARSGLFL